MFRLIPAIDQTYLSFQRPRGLGLARSLILTHSGSGLVPRKTVIGINIATSASRSIGNLRWWLLDRESVADICGQASFVVKVGEIQEAD
jgi:hypothetical protein